MDAYSVKKKTIKNINKIFIANIHILKKTFGWANSQQFLIYKNVDHNR